MWTLLHETVCNYIFLCQYMFYGFIEVSFVLTGNVRGGRQGAVGGNGFGNRPRPGGYHPRVQPGAPIPQNDHPILPPPVNRPRASFIPPPNFDAADRPRLSLKPRSNVVNVTNQERELTEREKAIFGVGKPREPSPLR